MDSIVIRRTEAPAFLGLSQSTIDRMCAAGKFVPKVRLGEQATGFLRADLEAWLAARKEAHQ